MTLRHIFIILTVLLVTHAYADSYGGQSMVAPLRSVLVRAPDKGFANADPKQWHYTAQPNYEKALQEHKDFVKILESEGVQVHYHEIKLPHHADALFVHDPAILTDRGAILLNMGKPLRRGEESAIGETFKKLGIPILGHLSKEAFAEAGDMLWLDTKTLAIGRGFRTNQNGIDEIRQLVQPSGIEVIQVELPYNQGQEACLHLQSLISLVDYKKAAVFPKLLPVSFMELLKDRGFELIEVPEKEYLTMGTNILAIKPGVILTISENTQTKKLLEQAGCRVLTYTGNEISHKAEGGATCLTRPLLREMSS